MEVCIYLSAQYKQQQENRKWYLYNSAFICFSCRSVTVVCSLMCYRSVTWVITWKIGYYIGTVSWSYILTLFKSNYLSSKNQANLLSLWKQLFLVSEFYVGKVTQCLSLFSVVCPYFADLVSLHAFASL